MVTAAIDGLAVGPHASTVTITPAVAGAATTIVPVTLTVYAAGSWVMSLDRSQLAFTATVGGAPPATQDVRVDNLGASSLAWTTTCDAPWAHPDASGTTPAGFSQLSVGVDPQGLAAGTHTAHISVVSTAVDSPRTVTVTLTIAGAPTTTGGTATTGGGTGTATTSGTSSTGATTGASAHGGGRHCGAGGGAAVASALAFAATRPRRARARSR